jgi:hypothetical protein
MDFRLLLACSVFALLYAGCGPDPIAYHSTASVPYYTSSTSTQMEAIQRQEDSAEKPYVIFAAEDNDRTGYVLIAPTGASSRGSNFDAADFDRAVPLKGENLDSLIEGLGGAIDRWGTESEGGGSFYEFVHMPEDDIEQVSENVVEYYPSVRFTISKTEDGPIGRLVLGASPDEKLQSVIEMEEKEAVQTFRNLLMRAQEQAEEMEG